MASAHRLQNPSSSNSKPPRNPLNPKPTSHAHYQFPYPTTNATAITRCTPTTTTSPAPASQEDVDVALSSSSHLTRHQLLRRRSRHLKQLSKCYRDHYWALMEELKLQYREYYWRYGVSPFKQEQQQPVSDREFEDGNLEGSGENVNNSDNNNVNFDVKCNQRCVFVGCKLKAMPLTSFCHLHILSDSKQKLYKACSYVIKSAQAGPITCGKPILRSTVPSLCSVHFQKAQKHVTRALRKAGLNVSSSSKLAPKFHVIVAEYVRQIQVKRRALRRANRIDIMVKEESAS